MIHDLNVPQNQPKAVAIPESEMEAVACKECGHTSFIGAVKLFRVSALHPSNQSNKEQMASREVLVCVQCDTDLDTTKEIKN